MISTKIVITMFGEQYQKLSFMFISKIQILKDIFNNSGNYQRLSHLKFEFPTALG